MTARAGRGLLVTVLLVAMVALVGVAGATADGGVDPADAATIQNGTVDNVTIDRAFVGAVVDEGTATVEASGVLDGDENPVDGERVTVTIGGDPVTTATVESGTLTATVDPAVLDLDPQDGAEVGLYGFETDDPATVDIVHEVLDLDAGYTLHSVPQGAELVATDVAAVNVWDAESGTYDAVTDPVFDTPDDLNRALYVSAVSDDARLGHTFDAGPPTPGQEALGAGWNFVGSNFDISGDTGVTLQDDLVGVDASEYTIFTANFSEELDPGDTVGPYDGYWVFVDGEDIDRATVAPTYSSEDREETLGIDGSDFQVVSLGVETSTTGSGGLVEVTATVENQGDTLDTQFVDLLAENNTGAFERVDRTGLELDPGTSKLVTMSYEADETTQFDVSVTTDDSEATESITWDEPFFAVTDLSAPAQAEKGEPITVNATIENTGPAEGTQDVLFNLDPFGNFENPDVQVVVAEDLTLAAGESQPVELTVDTPNETGEFDHGIFTANSSETASLLVGDNQVEGALSNETVSLGGVSGANTVTVDFTLESTDDTQRDIRAYELDITFDPSVVTFSGAGLAEFPESANLTVNDENADEGTVRLVALSTAQALTPVTAGQLTFEAVAPGETSLAIDPAESDIQGPGGEARNPVWSPGSVTVESTSTAVAGATAVGAGSGYIDSTDWVDAGSSAGGSGDAHNVSAGEASSEQSVRKLTLVTGHTVTVIGDEDRRYVVEGPEGGDARYRGFQQDGDTYILPARADTSLYSNELFNIDLLLDQGYADAQVEGTPVIVTFEEEEFTTMAGEVTRGDGGGFEAFDVTAKLGLIDAVAGVATGEAGFAAGNRLDGVAGVFLNVRHEVSLDGGAGAIDAPAARDSFDVNGSGVDLAVLDTGIDADHPDFGDRVIDREDFTGDGLGDRQGHGTHVAGIAAGDGTESNGQYVGIAPGANLMDVKVLNDAGSGAIGTIVQGIEYAVDNNADIISMSLGGPVQSNDPLVDAVEAAVGDGVTVVVSAGNEGTGLRTISSPGNAEAAITVGATEEPYDQVAPFSSAGPTELAGRLKPEVVAPGFPITSTGSESAGEFPYTTKGGTSMAAPMVSGLTALVLESEGDLTPAEVKSRLVTTADPVPDFEGDVFRQGGGQINATAALGTDVVVRNATRSFGVVENATQRTAVFQVENVGSETVTLDTSVSVLNVETNETLDNAVLNASTVTVAPGERAAVELTLDIGDGFGVNSGVLTFEGNGERYRAIFGYARGLQITVEKLFNDKNERNDVTEGLYTWSSDGTFQDVTFEAFLGKTDYSLVLPGGEFELGFWTISEYEDIPGEALSEAAYAVKENVVVNSSNTRVTIDETDTVARALNTSAVSEQEPFDVLDYQANVHAALGEEPTSENPSFFTGGFGQRGHYSPISASDNTTISTNYQMVPADDVGDGGGLDSPLVYTLVGATESLEQDSPDFVVDPERFADEEMTLYRTQNESYDISSFYSAADQETYPGQLPISTPSTVGTDREEMTWVRNAAGQYEHVFRVGDTTRLRYVGTNWSPEVGETVSTPVNAGPFVPNANWTVDDRLDIDLAWATDQGEQRLAARGFGEPSALRVAIDGETVIDETSLSPEVTVDGPIGPDTDVAVELDGLSLEQDRDITTYARYTGNSDDPAPPDIASVDVLGYAPNEAITSSAVTLAVEVDSPGGLDPRLFRAYYSHSAFDRPTEDWRSWDRGDIEHLGNGTFHVDVPIEAGADRLDIAFRALDNNGNSMEVATLGAVPVDLALSAQRPTGTLGTRLFATQEVRLR